MNIEVGGFVHWVRQVYVAKEARRMGVYSAIHNGMVDIAKADPSCKCVRLYVMNTNKGAQATYENLGMRVIPNLSLASLEK